MKRQYLLFQLYGPLVSWGDIAVGEVRRSLPQPTKSALLGLVAATLGYRRDEEELHSGLHARFHVGARIDSPGSLMVDYHTAQVAAATHLKRRKSTPLTRRDELRPRELETILSRREYRCDALAVAALRLTSEGDPDLDEIRQALEEPAFAPYLGRRSCPPALPFAPRIVDAASMIEALRSFDGDEQYRRIARMVASPVSTFVWEGEADAASGAIVQKRRDALVSRARWQFREREQYRIDEENAHVSQPD
jgi:CRISPR system Cascade subunit CasD